MSRALTGTEAHRIYNILVQECAAPTRLRVEFVRYHTEQQRSYPTEYRFQGLLGFGGKFWNGYGADGWYITYYNEHKNDEKEAAMNRANERLRALRKELTL